jgi:dolichol-phosphate mannosyltransferase
LRSSTKASWVAAVIPCYRVTSHIADVIAGIGPEVARIYCIDDKCPDGSGEFVLSSIKDPRVSVIFHDTNQGVGGAMISGYRAALAEGADVIVKIDGDGQMDAALVPAFVGPILHGHADYTKGNRFFRLEDVQAMPNIRLLGNAALAFFSKFSTGYWNVFDPTNGYTAIHRRALVNLPLDKISRDYFFESDMLFRLNTIGAVVIDIPMVAKYGNETSSLRVSKVILPFARKHLGNFAKRIFYNYYLRDFNLASVELAAGALLFGFGVLFGLNRWIESAVSGIPATAGTVMLAAFPALAGLQLLLGFLNFDMQNIPLLPLQKRMGPSSDHLSTRPEQDKAA